MTERHRSLGAWLRQEEKGGSFPINQFMEL